MKSHLSVIRDRMIRAGIRNHSCRYRVIAVGVDGRSRIISIATNSPRLPSRGLHAEERLIHRSPRSLVKILLLRVSPRGRILPIHPCLNCQKIARKRGVKIEPI